MYNLDICFNCLYDKMILENEIDFDNNDLDKEDILKRFKNECCCNEDLFCGVYGFSLLKEVDFIEKCPYYLEHLVSSS